MLKYSLSLLQELYMRCADAHGMQTHASHAKISPHRYPSLLKVSNTDATRGGVFKKRDAVHLEREVESNCCVGWSA